MTAKEFLSKAFYLDIRINSKIDQIKQLRALATKTNTVLSEVSVQSTKNNHKMESIILKIMEIENELNRDLADLLLIKVDIKRAIDGVDNEEYRTLLELRYIAYKKWEQIAEEMDFSTEHIYRMHRDALKLIQIPET